MTVPTQHPLLSAEIQDEYRAAGYWQDVSLAECVQRWSSLQPSKSAILGQRSLSYSELWTSARRLAGALHAGGLRDGDYLLAVLPNSWQGVVLTVASSIIGTSLSGLSPRVAPGFALNIARQVGARAVIMPGALSETEAWADALASMRRELSPQWMMQGATGSSRRWGSSLEESIGLGPELDAHLAPDPGRPSIVLTTGGTTGIPKCVLHCDNTAIYAATAYAAATGMNRDDIQVAYGPYGHASGSVFEQYMPLVIGATVLPLPRWNPLSVAAEIEKWGATYALTVGTHLHDLLAAAGNIGTKLSTLRVVASGAGPSRLFHEVEEQFGFRIVRGYGMSECLGHSRSHPDDSSVFRLDTDGCPFPGVEYRLLEPGTESPVEYGPTGEYVCRAPSLFMGYLGQPDLTATALTRDGFYRSGDLITSDESGRLTWAGRLRDVIRRGGLQIDIREMEELVARLPGVADVTVVGIPDSRLGERAAVVITLRGEARIQLSEVVAYLAACGLSRESLPEYLATVDQIPRTSRGKVDTDAMRGRVKQLLATSSTVVQVSPTVIRTQASA